MINNKEMNNFEQTINYIRDVLRKEGVTGMDSIKHCIVFILCRYLTNDKCNLFNIDEKYSFDNIKYDENNELLDKNLLMEKFYNKKINCFIGELNKKLYFKMDFKIDDVKNLRLIIDKLNDINIENLELNCDIIGFIYESHLKTGTSASGMRDLGQYYTSRILINYMISLCDLKQNDKILDPSCGSGGFLTMSVKYLNDKYKNIDWSTSKKNIYGFDIDENVKNMTLLNLLLETGHLFDETIIKQDTLQNDITNPITNETHKFDVILANEPFGLKNIEYKDCCKKIKDLKIKGSKGEPLFLQLMAESLEKNGRCAVIVPEGVLFNDSTIHTGTRKHLIENYNVKKIIFMNDQFFMNTAVKCAVIYFENNDGRTKEITTGLGSTVVRTFEERGTKDIEFYEIKYINNNIDEKLLIKVNKADIIKNNYNLGLNKYVKVTDKKIDGLRYEKLGDVCEFLSKSKRQASYGKELGKYPFYTSSKELTKYCDEADYYNECLIFGTGGNANVKYSNNFSCSSDNFIVTSKSTNNKYMYYWFLHNMYILNELFKGTTIKHLSKENLQEIEIPIPPLETQKQIVTILDGYYEQIERNKKSIEAYESFKNAEVWGNTINQNEKLLGDIISVKQGDYITKNEMNEGIYGVYGGGNATYYIDKYNNENTLIIAKDGVSENCIRWINDKFFVNHHAWTINILKDNIIIDKYIYYYLWYIQNKIYKLAEGSAQKGINQKNFLNITIPIISLDKQQELIKKCEYFDEQIKILTKENEMLENNNIIDVILNSIDSNKEELIVENNNDDNQDSEIIITDKKEKKKKPSKKSKESEILEETKKEKKITKNKVDDTNNVINNE
jgi:type I restriction-modification system DNA methylase subunit/restriction endonuclease S subunit